jgi:hypothetical protein
MPRKIGLVAPAMVVCTLIFVSLLKHQRRDEMQRGVQPTYHAFSYVARKADARDKGYDLGYKFGRLTAISGKPVPSDESLQAAVSQMASYTSAIPAADKKKFAEAFRSGFARGYRDASTPAL